MDVQYSAEVRRSPERLAALQRISTQLPKVVTPRYAPEVRAAWDFVTDAATGDATRLALEDTFGRVWTDFTPNELANPLHVGLRLYHLWGDLLQVRSDQQHATVEAMVADFGSDSEGE